MPAARQRRAVTALAAVLLGACATAELAVPPKTAVDSATYAADIADFHAKRLEAIAGPDGWSTLAGLFWLDSASYSIGSAAASTIRLPADHTPPAVGTLRNDASRVTFLAARGTTVMVDSTRIDSVTLANDKAEQPTVLRTGSLTYRLIERGGRQALRVKDSAYVLRRDFKGLTYFPTDTSFRVQAHLVPHPAPRTVRILNVLGMTEEYRSPGVLHFRIGGTAYALTATFEGKDTTQYFMLFRDATSKETTYPAGRFMYATLVDSAGYTILDFNRAYNPPCAFTAFATCPLPPAGNVLTVAIPAGEKRYAGPHGAELR
ncbi:MAG: DUF1684 domain-containing protein [Gemmatimonadaceae bacterium]|nr:DUF1684 domain-containing protein [Gemmatimonadaceae bacterium]